MEVLVTGLAEVVRTVSEAGISPAAAAVTAMPSEEARGVIAGQVLELVAVVAPRAWDLAVEEDGAAVAVVGGAGRRLGLQKL